jgi:hypothetical protein
VWITAPGNVTAGSNFTATVNISNISNFDSANYDISYNASVIEVTGVINGSLGATVIPVSDWGFIPPGIQGTVRIINNVPGSNGASGQGLLSQILFHVNGSAGDTSHLNFTGEHVLYDNTSTEIPATWLNDSVTVQ